MNEEIFRRRLSSRSPLRVPYARPCACSAGVRAAAMPRERRQAVQTNAAMYVGYADDDEDVDSIMKKFKALEEVAEAKRSAGAADLSEEDLVKAVGLRVGCGVDYSMDADRAGAGGASGSRHRGPKGEHVQTGEVQIVPAHVAPEELDAADAADAKRRLKAGPDYLPPAQRRDEQVTMPSLVPLEAAGLLGGGASLPRSGADMPPLVVHPGSSAVIHQAHGAVLAALLAPQLRAPDSQDFWFCDRGGFDALRAPETISVLHDSGSVSHLAARRFYALVLPGLGSDGRMQPSQSVLALSSFEDDAQLVREALLAGSARALLGLADGEGPVGFDGEVGRMLAVAPSWFASEDWHRSRGYVLATGYLARRRKLVRSLREIITEARMAAHINASGLDTSLEHGYEATADMLVAIPSALAHSLQRLAWFVRRAPCERLTAASPARRPGASQRSPLWPLRPAAEATAVRVSMARVGTQPWARGVSTPTTGAKMMERSL